MCGVFAIINQKEDVFDYQTFCTLGAANDRRGGDSCGIFIDGAVEYGIGIKSKFEDFFWDSDLLNNTTRATIALGHDRKASIGGITLEKAHPIVISESVPGADGEEAKEEIKFVMVHNGTVYDYEDLAKKYIPQIDVKGMSDSQVIARLLYYSGFDWLAEYNGGAAFIAVDYRKEKPQVLIWRGESKKFSTSTEMEEERPLFCNLENGRLVISSIPSYLAITDGNCYIVPANQVLTYREGKLWTVKKIDRSKAQQDKKYEWAGYSGNNNYSRQAPVNPPTVMRYLRPMSVTNTYKIEDNNADGYVRMTSFGKVLTKYDSITPTESVHIVYFFDGIPLKEKKAYMFLCKALKRTKLDVEGFVKMYQNFIRYFSTDQLYFDGVLLYKATSPFGREPYTGYLQMLTDSAAARYLCGIKQHEQKINTVYEGFNPLKNIPNFDYKTIWKEFIQSMG